MINRRDLMGGALVSSVAVGSWAAEEASFLDSLPAAKSAGQFDTLAHLRSARAPRFTEFAKTSGYATLGDGGGAIYRRTTTEPGHPGKLRSADGSWWELVSLQATPQMFGAAADGSTDDTDALRDWLEFGGALHAPRGTYLIASAGPKAGGVWAEITRSLQVRCHPEATFRAGRGLERDMLRLLARGQAAAANELDIDWSGGRFDQTAQSNSTVISFSKQYPASNPGSAAVADGLSIRGEMRLGDRRAGFRSAKVRDVLFVSSPTGHWQSAGGDSNLFIGGTRRVEVLGTRHVGARDAGVYVSGVSAGIVEGIAGWVENCSFDGCLTGVTSKRFFSHISLSSNMGRNTARLVYSGVVTGGGTAVIMEDNIGQNAWRVATARDATGSRISGNISYDHGHLLEDGSPALRVFNSGNACVLGSGLTYSQIDGNFVHGRSKGVSHNVCAVRLSGSGEKTSRYNRVFNNGAHGVDAVVIEEPGGADQNQFWNNMGTSLSGEAVRLSGRWSLDRSWRARSPVGDLEPSEWSGGQTPSLRE